MTAADRRAAELGTVASLLNVLTPRPGWSYPTIKQADYDTRRPPAAMRVRCWRRNTEAGSERARPLRG
jgi:hypothetical protein